MNLEKIKEVLKDEPSYRLQQVKKAVFSDLIENWQEATNLPQNLRQKLQKKIPLNLLDVRAEKISSSTDQKTIKILFLLQDGLSIESVLMKHQDGRMTACVSSQVGCPIGCKFCATGKQGFKRNLSVTEITDQVLYFSRLLKKDEKTVTNVVFMGMGEPLLNYDNVLNAIKILNDKEYFNIGARKISVSTSGITEGILRLANEKIQLNLAVSLHAPNDAIRSSIMPINNKYPIKKILLAVDQYIKLTKRKVMFEYLLIRGVNDSPENARELANLLNNPLYMINLISFNPVVHGDFKPSPALGVKKFKEILISKGIETTQRYRFGKEIKAACGQLKAESDTI